MADIRSSQKRIDNENANTARDNGGAKSDSVILVQQGADLDKVFRRKKTVK
jgi:hypothetical protein